MSTSDSHDEDDYMRHYLAQADLAGLDLHDIDLQADMRAERRWEWLRLVSALSIAGALMWFMSSDFYLFHGHGTALVPIVWALLLASLAAAGGQGFALGQALGWPGTAPWRHRLPKSTGVRSQFFSRLRLSERLQRYLLLCVALGLGAVLLFYLPREAEWQGGGYSGQWFLGVGIALIAGIALGRWLIAQAAFAQSRASARASAPPFVWPPRFKWVTLTLIGAGALFAAFGHLIVGNAESSSVGFGLSGVGLMVGICGAIWIARRFDEWEAEFRKRAAQDRRLP